MILFFFAIGYIVGIVVFASMHHPATGVVFEAICVGLLAYVVALELLWKERAGGAFASDLIATVPALMFGAAGCLLTPFVGVPLFLIVWFFVFRGVFNDMSLVARTRSK